MTPPAGATSRDGEARPTSAADHGTGRDLRNAHHPPPPRAYGRDGATSLLASPRGRSFATARLPSAVAGRSRFCAARTAFADRLRYVRRRLATLDRAAGVLASGSSAGTPAHPPGRRPRRTCRRGFARRPCSLTPWARPSDRGIPSSSRGRELSEAKREGAARAPSPCRRAAERERAGNQLRQRTPPVTGRGSAGKERVPSTALVDNTQGAIA